MENNELNNKILKNVRNKIVVSNLEKEEAMKISKRKQAISLCATVIILLSGSFLTVNAATDGQLAENIKEKYKEIITINYDESKYKLVDVQEGKDPVSGENTVTYRTTSIDNTEEMVTIINTDNLDDENLKLNWDLNEDGESEMTIENK